MNDRAKDESMAFPSSDKLRLVSVLIDYPEKELLEFLAVALRHATAPPVRRCLQAMGGLAETLEETAPAYAALLRPLARTLGENGGPEDRRSPERKPTFDP